MTREAEIRKIVGLCISLKSAAVKLETAGIENVEVSDHYVYFGKNQMESMTRCKYPMAWTYHYGRS